MYWGPHSENYQSFSTTAKLIALQIVGRRSKETLQIERRLKSVRVGKESEGLVSADTAAAKYLVSTSPTSCFIQPSLSLDSSWLSPDIRAWCSTPRARARHVLTQGIFCY